MKLLRTPEKNRGLTLVELLAVFVVIAMVAFLLLPIFADRHQKPLVAVCLSHLKQVALAQILWANDHEVGFPALASTNQGGSLEYLAAGRVDLHCGIFVPYVPYPGIFHCPADKRQAATDYSLLNNSNLSYFASLNAIISNAGSVLAGDRNLTLNGSALSPGMAILTATSSASWTKDFHSQAIQAPRGNFVFGDGHAEALQQPRLNAVVSQLGTNVNRLAFP